jgi:hypothetical protein
MLVYEEFHTLNLEFLMDFDFVEEKSFFRTFFAHCAYPPEFSQISGGGGVASAWAIGSYPNC